MSRTYRLRKEKDRYLHWRCQKKLKYSKDNMALYGYLIDRLGVVDILSGLAVRYIGRTRMWSDAYELNRMSIPRHGLDYGLEYIEPYIVSTTGPDVALGFSVRDTMVDFVLDPVKGRRIRDGEFIHRAPRKFSRIKRGLKKINRLKSLIEEHE